MRGELRLILGNMFSGKTTRLIQEVDDLREFAKKKILVMKPTTDTRSGNGKIKHFRGITMDAIEVPVQKIWSIFRIIREKESEMGSKFHVIAFDEIQFFPNEFFRVVDELLRQEYDIIAAGLILDFRGEPFGPALFLLGLCQKSYNHIWLNSRCARCAEPAHLPQRLCDGKPVPYDSPQILVGGTESYEPRCFDCHELPGKPAPPL